MLAGRNGHAITRRFSVATGGGGSMLDEERRGLRWQRAWCNVDSKSTRGVALRSGGDAVIGWRSGGLASRLSADAEHLRPVVGLRLRPGPACPDVEDAGAEPDRGPRYVRMPRGCELACPAPYAPIGCYGNGCNCGASGDEAGYLPGAGPMNYSQPQPTMAPPPAAALRDDSFTWR